MPRVGVWGRSVSAPTDLPGCVLWSKADAGITYDADGQHVAQWDDLSGAGHHLIQATSSARPLFVASAVNGLPALRSNGVDQFLRASFTLGAAKTVFAVLKIVGNIASSVFIGGGDGSLTSLYIGMDSSGAGSLCSIRFMNNAQINSSYAFGPSSPNTGYVLLSSVCDAGTETLRMNGVREASTAAAILGCGGITLFTAGNSTRFSNVEIAECIAYSRDLSPGEMVQVERYLTQRYALGNYDGLGLSNKLLTSMTDIGNCLGWYRADQVVLEAATQLVQQWTDLTGNGRHMTQGTSANRPTKTTHAALAGRETIQFTSAASTFLLGPALANQPITIIAVLVPTAAVGRLFEGVPSPNGAGLIWSSATTIQVFDASGGVNATLGSYLNTGSVVTIIANGSASRIRWNGRNLAMGNLSAGTVIGGGNGFKLGSGQSGNNMDGHIAEFMAYSRTLVPGEITMIERSLVQRYNLTPELVH